MSVKLTWKIGDNADKEGISAAADSMQDGVDSKTIAGSGANSRPRGGGGKHHPGHRLMGHPGRLKIPHLATAGKGRGRAIPPPVAPAYARRLEGTTGVIRSAGASGRKRHGDYQEWSTRAVSPSPTTASKRSAEGYASASGSSSTIGIFSREECQGRLREGRWTLHPT